MNPQLEELAFLYALDQLNPSERAAFEARLDHDAALAEWVRELQDAGRARSVIAGAVKNVIPLPAHVIPVAGVDHIFAA